MLDKFHTPKNKTHSLSVYLTLPFLIENIRCTEHYEDSTVAQNIWGLLDEPLLLITVIQFVLLKLQMPVCYGGESVKEDEAEFIRVRLRDFTSGKTFLSCLCSLKGNANSGVFCWNNSKKNPL